MRAAAAIGAACLVLLGTACGSNSASTSAGAGKPETATVEAYDYRFEPTTLNLTPGANVTVTLVNKGDSPHTFTVDDLDVNVEAQPGESQSVSFTAPESGAVAFHCHFHPDQMMGTISVDGSQASPMESGGMDSNDSGENDNGY
jgi:plastocyanin